MIREQVSLVPIQSSHSTNKKWPLGIDPGGHHFVVLHVSINNRAIFLSRLVTFDN